MPFQKMPDDTLASLSILRYWPLLPTPLWTNQPMLQFQATVFQDWKDLQSCSKNSKDFRNNIHTHF